MSNELSANRSFWRFMPPSMADNGSLAVASGRPNSVHRLATGSHRTLCTQAQLKLFFF